MHPDMIIDSLTSRQLSEWEAYDKIDPIGEWREDYRFAQLMALVTNIVTKLYAKDKPKMVEPIDFMPDYSGDIAAIKEDMESEKMKKQMYAVVRAFGGKV